MLPDYFALNLVRLDNDWSYQTLANKMAEAGVGIPFRTLHYLLTHDDKGARSRDRTLHKVRKFLRYAHDHRWTDYDITGDDDAPELRSHDVAPAGKRKRGRPRLRAQPVPRG